MVASRAVFLSTGKILATGHGSHCVGRLPRPRKGLEQGHHRLCFLLVPSVRQTVHRSGHMGNAGELLAIGNGDATVSLPNFRWPASLSPSI
jgi:hypothetical protein